MSIGSRSWLFSLTALYAISISTSMAAMEGVSALLGIWAIVALAKRASPKLSFDDVTLVTSGLIATIFLSLIFGSVHPVTWGRALGLIKNLIIFLLLRQVLADLSMQDRMRLAWLALGASAFVGFVALSQHFTCHDYFRGQVIFGAIVNGDSDCRAVGLFSSSMTYSHSVLLPASILVGLVFVGQRPTWGILITALGVWGGLFAAFQRGPWIGFFAAVLIASAWLTRRVVVGFYSATFVMAAGLVASSDQLRGRLLSIFSLQSGSNRERFDLWQANWEIFKDHPILGVGFSHSDKLLPEYFQKLGITNGFVSHAHNNVIDFLSGTGLVGVGFYLGLIGFITYRSYKASIWPKSWRVGFMTMQVALFVAGLTECNFKDGEITHQFVFWAALALATLA